MRTYHRAGVPHYWIIDPDGETLTVCRCTADGYLVAIAASREGRIQAEPFDALELHVGALFTEDDDED